MLVDLGRRADLLDLAVVEDRDAVAHRERLFLVVRDVDERDADLLLDPLQLGLHLLAELEVERAERLVEQEHLRAVDDRAGERDPLALAAGELRRLAAAEPAEPHELERLGGALRRARRSDAFDPQPVGDVLADGHVREERVVLEDGVHVPRVRRLRGHVRAFKQDPALVGRSKPAIRRSVVVLPEPEGPSIVKNSPAGTSRSTPSTATTSPYAFVTDSRRDVSLRLR